MIVNLAKSLLTVIFAMPPMGKVIMGLVCPKSAFAKIGMFFNSCLVWTMRLWCGRESKFFAPFQQEQNVNIVNISP